MPGYKGPLEIGFNLNVNGSPGGVDIHIGRRAKMFKFKRRLAVVAIPATLALGALTYGSVVAMAAPSPSPTAAGQPSASAPADSATSPGESATEQPESATEAVEPNEPAQPNGGFADDPANSQADTQQEGVH